MGKYDDARAEREFRLNPPSTAPGQGSGGDEWGDDLMNGLNDGLDSNDFMGGDIDLSMLDEPKDGSQNGTGGSGDPQSNLDSLTAGEKAVMDTITYVCKAIWNFLVTFVETYRNNTEEDKHNLGIQVFKFSLVAMGVGMFFVILHPFVSSINQPSDLVIGGLISCAFGVVLMMFNDMGNNSEVGEPVIESTESEDYMGYSSDPDIKFNDDLFIEDDPSDDIDDSEAGWGDFNGDDLFIIEEEPEEVDNTNKVGSDDFTVDSAMDRVSSIPAGTQTRQYLFETFSGVLPNITPSYSEMKTVSVENDEFMWFSDALRSAAYQVGTKEESVPELMELREGIMLIQIRATRPPGIKEKEIANAVADLYSRDEDNNVVRFGVYATVDSTVGCFIVNIFTGESVMVSLNDVYGNIKDFVLDPKVTMPFVWGISEIGKPYYCDLINCDSIIITGETRSGKSWKGQSIVAQLCMYNSPKEIEFYVFDNKGNASDYKYLSSVLPHVKYFCGDYSRFNSDIKTLLDDALEVRGKILNDANCINIKDYNSRHPESKLPYMYILIDELMALMDLFDKDQTAEFRKLLSTIVSKFPYLGIRLILFPHRIVDNVISKNAYSLVSSRAGVRLLLEDELKNSMGVTKKTFPYNLVNNGDMALRTKEIAGGNTVFCHAEVLTMSNAGNRQLFEFIGSVWRRLIPECECITFNGLVGGSIRNVIEKKKKKSEIVDHTNGREEYSYEGYNSSVDDIMDTFDGSDSDVDEDFWKDILG